MTSVPIINESSNTLLQSMIKDLPQSILLTGPNGVGLGTIAKYVASSIGGVRLLVLPEKNEKIDIENGTISVDSIRNLRHETRSIQSNKLVVVIDYAERMGTGAQNAFLKLLEEPNSSIYFILATHDPSKLLPTITSRAQAVNLRPVSLSLSSSLISELGVDDKSEINKILFMAQGLPAEITRLATDKGYLESRSDIMRDARDLLKATIYEKLLLANKYKDDRVKSLLLIDFASKILQHSITTKPSLELIAQIDKLLICQKQLQANSNVRLSLASIVI